ncbi:unnamed protein product [Ambrosiozyma monospora]|uniref:Unnamed protein product n=1 Tax=Ambrosiozyma monospora TaxID=43982 RepID=A0ACB5TDH2_AMBMO|nr:unnamed protein product [Ambrosiozyma monospora]
MSVLIRIKSIGRPYLVISGVVCNTVHIRSLNWVGVTPYAHHLIIANEDARLINVKNTDLVKAYGDSDIEYEEDHPIEDIFLQRGFELVKKYSQMTLFKAKTSLSLID